MHIQVNCFKHLLNWPLEIGTGGESEAQATWQPALLNRSGTCRALKLCIIQVTVNPARLVRLRTENNARRRYLTREEYDTLLSIIRRDNPAQVSAFIVSVYTGMRWGEQLDRK